MTEILTQPITGYGGGGGDNQQPQQQHTPVEASDTLHSRQYGRILDLIGEGEGYGLVNGMQSIYFDNTPVQNPDLSFNFHNCSFITQNGTQGQAYIPGFASVEAATNVGVKVTTNSPHTEHIVNVNANAVRVTVGIPTLLIQDSSNGDINGTSVNIRIDLQTNGGGFVQKINDVITGKTTTRYERDYTIELTGAGPWDIRVRRITADSASVSLSNDTWWDSYTTIIDSKLSYPNSILVGTKLDASQFKSIPTRSFDMYLLLIKVPNNYDPISRQYSGTWDGDFKIAWSDNPAWCFYDLLTSTRYGLGKFLPVDLIDKWTLYSIAQYCDQLVDDGFGGMEPRFRCNLYIQSQEEAFNVISHFASIFNSIVYWSSAGLTVVQDRPGNPVALFNQTNVIDGVFEYSGSSLDARHTVALVSWINPDNNYKQEIEYVEDAQGIALYGVKPTSFVAFGCTSRGQARRQGLATLYSERKETETVTFKTSLQFLSIYPGAIINVHDPARAGKRFGGRIVTANTTSINIDAPITIENGFSYTCWVTLPNGTVIEKNVANGLGSTSTITFTTAVTTASLVGATWILTATNLKPQTFRVISIQESGPVEYTVTALAHSESKYVEIENGIILQDQPISIIESPVISAPTSIQFKVNGYADGEGVRRGLLVSWGKPAIGTPVTYMMKWRRGKDAYVSVENLLTRSYEINPAYGGQYDVIVYAFNGNGVISPGAAATYNIDLAEGTGSSLSAVTGLTVLGGGTTFTGQDLNVQWVNPSSNNNTIAVLKDFRVEVYDNSNNLLRTEYIAAVAPGATQTYAYTFAKNTKDGGPRRTIVLSVRARDTSNKLSNATQVSFTNPAPGIPNNIVVSGFFEGVKITFDLPSESDFAGILIWADTTNGFTVSSANLLYDGKDNYISLNGLTGGTTYYFHVAAYDTFGKSYSGFGLNLSGQQSATTIASIPADQLSTNLGTANLTPNGDFEVDTNSDGLADGWTAYSSVGGESATGSIVATGGQFAPHTQKVAFSTNTGQKGISNTLGNSIGWIAGHKYVISCYVKASGDAVGKTMQLVWTNAPITTTVITNPALTTTFQRYAWKVTMGDTPEVSGNVKLSILGSTSAGSNFLEFDGFQIQLGENLTEFAPVPPGTIYGINIASQTVTTGNLAANSVTTPILAANAVTALNIVANTITADKTSFSSLSSLTANVGTLDTGIIYNHPHTKYLNLDSTDTSSSYFIYSPNFYVRGDGFTYIGANAQINGNLNAVNGTFSGTLTADAINAVNTINITDGAVTGRAAFSSNVTGNAPTGGGVIVSQTVTTTGGIVLVFATLSLSVSTDPSTFNIYRDGVLVSATGGVPVGDFVVTNIYTVDNPSAGSHVYQIRNTGTSTINYNNRYSAIVEVKR